MGAKAAAALEFSKIKEKHDELLKELEVIYDKCLRMGFALAQDELDLILLWKSAEDLKRTAESVAGDLKWKLATQKADGEANED